eukprot:CAMPEP_0182477824 /NCGR_PEP_ID=MMETSP1319-20130603/31513_1 /TAXON_ID=172717 /ORGANISM="Bolidomonas pacifica, Strain RCC208" /LENGTH=30 /DNA_ID= /DNA_START= /DNA_END= /DNA_ORIENTATION=
MTSSVSSSASTALDRAIKAGVSVGRMYFVT